MSTAYETLLVEEREDRVVVTLHRPEARNAISARMIAELHEVCGLLERDPRLLLLTGHGRVFAGGADIAELLRRGRDEALQGINSRLFERVRGLPMPTLAAVDGWALGGGAELAYACDLRIAGPDAVFGNPEPGLGILAAAGACRRLPELVGSSIAKQVLLAGRNLDADAALAAGLVVDVVPARRLLDEAHALLDRMARSSATALRLTKLVLDAPGSHPVLDDLAQAVLFEGQDKKDRMTRFLEKRSRA
ncbi:MULTISPECIES: enoyl-CoA hydratase/isomerase family protein [Streptomyces]|uniref:Enoyl-CoA hydratase/isomerase family protein n=1 Tax=Streptomyces caniscabiei TaxID=2746961 RepID=A0ABU4N6A1_9ACTN|nr:MULTISPECIES: enoyl-CoA hydratase/isomerase family protein [Streptomyces]MBE4739055.1 enoyl-CoA hydratase/isomerase family protein [Streptomyces caniscabiei]MBE4762661.1 enoyl-CoA hydratase/isomerase family protein [Streptomyces caniscabiei]MBE4788073.1 enoyl-CoA hydratase/isomerase family protein [Streptomyces caniscabiei]MBE4797295.1 enoyl-CoA hydratase/isomerase family protein [Streptomyces caniscabiei]MDX2949007.1 enoyl-CoA hydratase/isomerase family protein [Streptomyces caniscabiei]